MLHASCIPDRLLDPAAQKIDHRGDEGRMESPAATLAPVIARGDRAPATLVGDPVLIFCFSGNSIPEPRMWD